MNWTIERIEREVLSQEVDAVSLPESVIVDAVNRAQSMLGEGWIEAETRNQKGLGSAMRIIGMGLRLQVIESVSGNKELLDKLRKRDASADAELTAIYLLCYKSPEVEIEVFPPVNDRIADFRVRKGPEDWTTVEVAQATESAEHKRLNVILKQLTSVFRPLSSPFAVEVIFRREPTEEEVRQLCEDLPEFCANGGFQMARLDDELGILLLNHVPLGQLPHSSVPELEDVPYIGLCVFFRQDQVVTAKIAFSDNRAERMLREQSAQLPEGKRGLIMISGPSSESELQVWGPLIRRRFQPGIHTRLGGVCLFDGGMAPCETRYGWQVQAHLVLNPHAKAQLPSWIEETIIAADDAFEHSLSTPKSH